MQISINTYTKFDTIKAKDIPVGSIARVGSNDMHIVHTVGNGPQWMLIWPTTTTTTTGFETHQELGKIREDFDVVLLPKGTELTLKF